MNKAKTYILKNERLLTAVSFGFFVFMMLFNLMHSALWGDEWVEYSISQAGIRSGTMYGRIVGTFQPPLYNFIMHFWLKISTSLFWFRFFNVVIGSISFVFLYLTIKTLISKKAACLTTGVLAVCYNWVYCIQECSEYALMLCCVFGAIFFYVKCLEGFSYPKAAGFILSCVLAMYSQYGAVFVIVPLLILFFLGNVTDAGSDIRRKLTLILAYVFSLVFFAAPLYLKFARLQMAGNEISKHTVTLGHNLLTELPFTFGQIAAYLFGLNTGNVWPVLFGVMGWAAFILTILIIKGNADRTKKSLLMAMWIGYLAHYLLVQAHIYAMLHPNQSSGFFSRYSYFYIPIMSVIFPVLIHEGRGLIRYNGSFVKYAAVCFSCFVIGISTFAVLKNWHKSYDDKYAGIWMENEGWQDTTYVFGVARYGFNYYVTHADGYKDGFLDKTEYMSETVSDEKLAKRFWAWNSNWGNSGWKGTVERARQLGYTVEIYDDSGSAGQLAYCFLPSE